jgi:hypothetical protein
MSDDKEHTDDGMTDGSPMGLLRLQQEIHDALRVQHPEWVEANGECPTCESYESRLAELLCLSSPGAVR